VELFSWKFRLDAMYFTHTFYKNVRLNDFVKKHLNRDFIGSEKLNIVGEGLSTEGTKKLLEDDELSRFRDQVVRGCVNPDLNIPDIETGDVNRPFGTIEELVGNLVGTLESALVLSISDRGSVIDTVAGLTQGMSVQELHSILIDEIENNPYININDLPFITKINELSTERAGKVLEGFLYFWIYTTLRLGKNSP
jgi:hypothetical protein